MGFIGSQVDVQRRQNARRGRSVEVVCRASKAPARLFSVGQRLCAACSQGLWTAATLGVIASSLANVSAAAEESSVACRSAFTEPPALSAAASVTLPPPAQLPPLEPLERLTLPNGLSAFLVEDDEVPLVDGYVIMRAGSVWDPPDRIGLGALTAATLRLGGSVTHPKAELDRYLEEHAASIEASVGLLTLQISFQCAPEDAEPVLRAVASLVRAPLFPPSSLELAQEQARSLIARRNDDPSNIVQREVRKLVYGGESPVAREATLDTVNRIRREDVLRFHARHVAPDAGALVAIHGQWRTADMKRAVEECFGDWRRGLVDASSPPLSPASIVTAPASSPQVIYLADKPEMTQAHVAIAALGGEYRDPLYPPLEVINQLMNGLGGRLMNDLRTRAGLAYSVYGVWAPRYSYPGVFVAGGETKTDSVWQLLRGVRDEFRRLRQEPIPAEELAYAKESILNSMVFELAPGKAEMLRRLVQYTMYGYPEDFLYRVRAAVEQVTAEQVLQAAQTRIRDDRCFALVLGNRRELEAVLRTAAERVEVRPLSIE
ncbi:hypothetical protein CDCA_CDCA15G4073 [Cyanidium caldarium]|uniref:Insulinase family protein n=1 Tax=Cyanidium caldarium TaxID=2771 RepID=A0AAV9J0D8_CYACA|nr:hypothetical protein CDCA_CDCA15G4073 [Cyanidium caldarium]